MQAYDIFMLLVLVAAVVWGFWKGFAWQLASLASIALSYFVALNFRTPVAGFLANITNTGPPWNIFLAMLILFLGTALVVWISFNFVSDLIERVRLKEFDRQVGAIFGLLKGVVLCVVITLFAVTLLGEQRCQAICNSQSGHYIAWLLYNAEALMPGEVQNIVGPYVAPHNHNPNGMDFTTTNSPTYPDPNSQPVYSAPSYNRPDSYQANPQYDPRYSQPVYEQPQYQR